MVKKIVSALLCAMLVMSMASCSSKKYDYDLSEYVTLPDYSVIEISAAKLAEDLEETIDTLLYSKVETTEITDRAVAEGDIVNIDYTGYLEGETDPFVGGTGSGFELEIGSDSFIDGFEDSIIGHNIGDIFDADLVFPDEYPSNPDLAGLPVTFTITVNSIFIETEPDYTDEFISENTDYATIEEYEAAFKEGSIETYVWEYIVDNITVKSYPKDVVKEYYDSMVDSYRKYASAYYGYTLDDFVAAYFGQTMDMFLSDVASYAQSQVLNEMALYSIVRAENIEVTDEMYDAYIAGIIEEGTYASEKEVLEAYGSKTVIEENILLEEVIEILLTKTVDVE